MENAFWPPVRSRAFGVYEQHGRIRIFRRQSIPYHDGADVSEEKRRLNRPGTWLQKWKDPVIFDESRWRASTPMRNNIPAKRAGRNFQKAGTLPFISYRLASTRFCDEIALDRFETCGGVGITRNFWKKKGKYYQMFMAQKKYYEREAAHEA